VLPPGRGSTAPDSPEATVQSSRTAIEVAHTVPDPGPQSRRRDDE
jgi:hypothetical protein